MSYDDRDRRWYEMLVDYGAGANTLQHIIGPKGKAGLLWDYGCHSVAEAFAGSSTTPMISVGTVSNADAYGEEFDYGALAVAGGGKTIRTTYAETAAGFATYMVNRNLPMDTVVMVTHIAATGSPTGQAIAGAAVIWED